MKGWLKIKLMFLLMYICLIILTTWITVELGITTLLVPLVVLWVLLTWMFIEARKNFMASSGVIKKMNKLEKRYFIGLQIITTVFWLGWFPMVWFFEWSDLFWYSGAIYLVAQIYFFIKINSAGKEVIE